MASSSMRPRSPRTNMTVPRITIGADDLFLEAFKAQTARQFHLLGENEVDIKFDDAVAPEVLRALQRLPKPGRAYQLSLIIDGKEEPVEAEAIGRTTFRVSRRRRVPPPLTPRRKP